MQKNGDLEKKLKYPQPHNIHIDTGNPAMDEHLRMKYHAEQKFIARHYQNPKYRR